GAGHSVMVTRATEGPALAVVPAVQGRSYGRPVSHLPFPFAEVVISVAMRFLPRFPWHIPACTRTPSFISPPARLFLPTLSLSLLPSSSLSLFIFGNGLGSLGGPGWLAAF